jgi:uncharacterized glyoxalase superfamily protein PhnB
MPARLDAVGIVARDLAASARFYASLGLDFGTPEPDADHIEATAPGGIRVMLDSEAAVLQSDPDWSRPKGTSIGLAFLCDSPTEVDSLYAQLLEMGYEGHREPWDAFWGQRYAQVEDPDGHNVDLFAAL